ncbi:MAG: nicotinamidase [Candidatus Longimicrobiales bacterium M2_2A_002]
MADITYEKDATALIVVDLQPDFMPGGALPVEGGDTLVPLIRDLVRSDRFGLHAATQDWHPEDHVSFASRHEGRAPMDVIELHGHDQTLWPDHCVQGTRGAELHADMDWTPIEAVIRKGTDPESDSYSGFRNNWNPDGERPATGLEGYLRERGIETVVLCGLARDVCVKWTAEDAADAGFRTLFLWDLTRPVDPESDREVRTGLEEAGVEVIEAAALG